jgi:esterase/lipase superfamily enzyme
MARRDFAEAIAILESAMSTDPDNLELQHLTSVARSQQEQQGFWKDYEKAASDTVVRVFYGTDRRKIDSDSKVAYSGDRSHSESLNLGFCDISIPPTHKTGRLETPKWWKLEFTFNSAKHVTLREVEGLTEEEFYTLLRQCVQQSTQKDAFVFIHGFNVSFEDGARRTAQIAYDLEFGGAPIMFSWPSCASIKGYTADEATIDWVLPHLRQFLCDIVDRGEIRTLHLIAHSMGNRALARVLNEIAISNANVRFNQVLLAAPDIDRGEFLQLAGKIKAVSERITLYASSSDKALRASQTLHYYPRAGEAGDNIVVINDVDTIDASGVDTDFLAHSYFCEDRTLLTDIFYLVREGKPPQNRYGLDPRPLRFGTYWVFRR